MIIIGIETATERLSASIIIEGEKKFELHKDSRSSHCELLTGFIMQLTGNHGVNLKSVDCIAVSTGPGSFTGLRIGIATAMGLAYGLGINTVPVNTLAALVWKTAPVNTLVCPLIDAKRSEVYTGLYRLTDGIPQIICEPAAVPVTKLGEILRSTTEQVTITGPSAEKFHNILINAEMVPISIAPVSKLKPSALAVAELGTLIFRESGGVNPALLQPVYLRRSDAEIARKKQCM
ncbi:MAG: tRNA (adenosine(37)-N6)-threonylcarbamoyltransferase complex dimerization subunit type 1 TsaB [Candidatus Latescibacteria bacterium]|nr:tRNA (adenosine(37)-N6)-threonylcarbamoyltransferase complex dimerization subunit type 1 TsaB [Candidatus Latescibacterota bacterium]